MTPTGLFPDVIRVDSPIAEYDVPRAWFWIEPIRGRVFSDDGPKSADEWMATEYDGAIKTWGVHMGDDIVACALARPTADPGIVELRMYWRKAVVVPDALRAITEELLTRYRRIEWRAWADSMNVFNMARQAGGTKEGILHRYAMRSGKPADVMLLTWWRE